MSAGCAVSARSKQSARKLARVIRTTDGATLCTIAEATAYMIVLPRGREMRQHWQHACRLILDGASAEAITVQVELALTLEGRIAFTAQK